MNRINLNKKWGQWRDPPLSAVESNHGPLFFIWEDLTLFLMYMDDIRLRQRSVI
jgi:hypothetical protein